jgi:hypothetical protein
MKTIIVVKGRSQVGKTPAILAVYNELASRTSQYKIVSGPEFHGKEQDVEVEFTYRRKRLGISSMGDPQSDLYSRLKAHVDNNCEVILTASRTSKSTVDDIKKLAGRKNNKYEIIWTSHYHHDNGTEAMPNGVDLNNQFTSGMVDLIQDLLK